MSIVLNSIIRSVGSFFDADIYNETVSLIID